jgi:hypothetical protein
VRIAVSCQEYFWIFFMLALLVLPRYAVLSPVPSYRTLLLYRHFPFNSLIRGRHCKLVTRVTNWSGFSQEHSSPDAAGKQRHLSKTTAERIHTGISGSFRRCRTRYRALLFAFLGWLFFWRLDTDSRHSWLFIWPFHLRSTNTSGICFGFDWWICHQDFTAAVAVHAAVNLRPGHVHYLLPLGEASRKSDSL